MSLHLFYEVPLPEIVLSLYKPTIWSGVEYCCHILAGALSCYLDVLSRLQKQICRTMWPAKVLSIDITLIDVHLNCLKWFHFLILIEGPFFILTGLMIFLSSFLGVVRMSIPAVSFLAEMSCGIPYLQSAFL